MKKIVFLMAIFAVVFPLSAATNSLEEFCPRFAANMPIVWQATNQWPDSFWIYKRLSPRLFPATVISNAMVLASLQDKKFPKPSTKDFIIWNDKGPNYLGPTHSIFEIMPKSATINYGLPDAGTNAADIPDDKILAQRAWDCAARLGVDASQMAFKEMTFSCGLDGQGNSLTNQIYGRGVFLARKLDDVLFWSSELGAENIDGFGIEFGSRGQVRNFSLVWPDLKRLEQQPAASPEQIIACIRAAKTMLLPNTGEPNYFRRLENLNHAQKLTITKITPYYLKGTYGDSVEDGKSSSITTPLAELEAVVDWGGSNAVIKLLSPILSPAARRLASP